jgi:limonene-1,2-epoxide hydrolase|tara:strand:- start:1001 stop:1360 length:360 start_codon:yes stop_codon:yes gene_type:complete
MTDHVVDNIIRSQIVEDYLDFFENKDLDSIAELFPEECCLVDWNVGKVIGKENVLNVYSNIFASVETIESHISHIHEDLGGILTCEMILIIDGEQILVADIFEFDDKDQIKMLRAYRGN